MNGSRYYTGEPDIEESRQHYATTQIAILQKRLNDNGHPPTFANLLEWFRQFGRLYDLGYRSESWERAA